MGRPSNRDEALSALQKKIKKGEVIVGAGAGTDYVVGDNNLCTVNSKKVLGSQPNSSRPVAAISSSSTTAVGIGWPEEAPLLA